MVIDNMQLNESNIFLHCTKVVRDTDDVQCFMYKSCTGDGRGPDPFVQLENRHGRGPDPFVQLGFHNRRSPEPFVHMTES